MGFSFMFLFILLLLVNYINAVNIFSLKFSEDLLFLSVDSVSKLHVIAK